MSLPNRISIVLSWALLLLVAGCSSDKKDTTGPAITPPGNLTAAALSHSSIRLTWSDNSATESGFRLERAPGAGDNWALVVETQSDVQAYTDTGLTEATAYRYRVKAFAPRSGSDWSAVATAATMLIAPTGAAASQRAGTEINLTWSDNSAAETAYDVERRRIGAGTFAPLVTLGAGATTLQDTGLAQNATYGYRIRARKDSLTSAWSTEARATTRVWTPLAPGNLQATATSQFAASLNWSDNAANEFGFVAEQSLQEATGWQIVDSVGVDNFSANISGLSSRTTYFFRIYAYNDSGRSPYSNIATCTTPSGPPPAPSNLTGRAPNYHAAILEWQDNSDEETGHELERKIGTSQRWDRLAQLGANAVGYIDSAVTPQTSYTYRVRALNADGFSAYSNEVRVSIPNPAPPAPSGLEATAAADRRIEVRWNDNSPDELGFKLERRPGLSGNFIEIADLGANVTTFSDVNVTPVSIYSYRVKAYNRIADRYWYSELSNVDSALTPDGVPNAPANLEARGVSISSIRLDWNDNSSNEQSFMVERRLAGDADFNLIAIVNGSARLTGTYIDTGLTHTTTYQYRVRASNGIGDSEFSNIAEGSTTNPVLLHETFDNYEVGRPPPRGGNPAWTDTVRGTSWVRVTDQISTPAGGRSVQFHDPDVGANMAILIFNGPSMSSGKISFNLRIPSIGWYDVQLANGSNVITMQLRFDASGVMYARHGSSFVSCGNYPLNQWFLIEFSFNFSTKKYTVYRDGDIVADTISVQNNNLVETRNIWFVAFIDQAIQDVYLDDFNLDLRQISRSSSDFIPPRPRASPGESFIKAGEFEFSE